MDCTSTTIAGKRTGLVRRLLNSSRLQWVWFLDADMVPPFATLQRLLAHQVPIVSALCCRRHAPYDIPAGSHTPPPGCGNAPNDETFWPLVLTPETPPLVTVDECGMGCMLIRREVFERVPEPWFPANAEGTREDWNFCVRARAAGYPVSVDTTLRVGHLTLQNLVPTDRRTT